jgi:hypothetical protein
MDGFIVEQPSFETGKQRPRQRREMVPEFKVELRRGRCEGCGGEKSTLKSLKKSEEARKICWRERARALVSRASQLGSRCKKGEAAMHSPE